MREMPEARQLTCHYPVMSTCPGLTWPSLTKPPHTPLFHPYLVFSLIIMQYYRFGRGQTHTVMDMAGITQLYLEVIFVISDFKVSNLSRRPQAFLFGLQTFLCILLKNAKSFAWCLYQIFIPTQVSFFYDKTQ